ncbi:hypothetical protein EJ08DRAFT_637030 [Tothia fuscella]|uniref:DUF1993 domain-containing protein n=1 Tax=Tothia fuscella TaxID=1048955 RepID=A0A9P4TW55_9PEZI|nr:hypothetical protein EJ08DRAFT_637030 [Tothia fuscella]
MPISFYDISVRSHLRGLDSLSNILRLAKVYAAENRIPIDELLEWRIIQDMNPLSWQVQYICQLPQNFLTEAAHLELDLPTIEDSSEETFADLEARVASTIQLLNSIDRYSVEGKEDQIAKGKDDAKARWGEFTGEQYLLGMNLPNFYFHLVTAYDILRGKGVPLGKREYLRPHFAEFVHK